MSRRCWCAILVAAMLFFACALVAVGVAEARLKPKLRMCSKSVLLRAWPRQMCRVLRVHDAINASGLLLSPVLFLNCTAPRSAERWAVSFTQLFNVDSDLSENTRKREAAMRERVASLPLVNIGVRDAVRSTDPTSSSWEDQAIYDSLTDLQSLYVDEECDGIATAIGAVYGVCGAGAIVTCMIGLVCLTGCGDRRGAATVVAGDVGGAGGPGLGVMADVSDVARRCRCGATASLTAMVCQRCDAALIEGVRANAFHFAPSGHDGDDDSGERSGGDAEQADKLCPVCLEGFKAGDELVALPCVHLFHVECVAAWLENKVACPTCQSPLAESAKRVEKALQDATLQASPTKSARSLAKSSSSGRKRRRRRRGL